MNCWMNLLYTISENISRTLWHFCEVSCTIAILAQGSRLLGPLALSETFAFGARGHRYRAMAGYELAVLDDKGELPEALVTKIKRIFIASFLVSLGAQTQRNAR